MQRIVIVYFDAGGGHRAAARALAESIRRQERPWQVISLNLDDVLEAADPIYRATGVRGGEIYNRALRMGWTAGSAQVIPIMHGAILVMHSLQVRLLRECWRRLRPDHANRVLAARSVHVHEPDCFRDRPQVAPKRDCYVRSDSRRAVRFPNPTQVQRGSSSSCSSPCFFSSSSSQSSSSSSWPSSPQSMEFMITPMIPLRDNPRTTCTVLNLLAIRVYTCQFPRSRCGLLN